MRPESNWPVEIRDTPHSGRGLFAKRDINNGEVLFEALPYSSTIMEGWRGNVCGFCRFFNNRNKLSTMCSSGKCRSVRYCSKNCRDLDEIQYHSKLTCENLQSLEDALNKLKALPNFENLYSRFEKGHWKNIEFAKDLAPGSLVELFDNNVLDFNVNCYFPSLLERNLMRFILATLSRRKDEIELKADNSSSCELNGADKSSNEFDQEENFTSIMKMQYNELLYLQDKKRLRDEMEIDTFLNYVYMYKFLRSIFEEKSNVLLGRDSTLVRDVIFREMGNSFGIWEETDDENDFDDVELLGYEIIPRATYFNHNCDPNVKRGKTNKTAIFMARRDIKQDEECTISYVGINDSREERQSFLKKYFFNCECNRCKNETSDILKI